MKKSYLSAAFVALFIPLFLTACFTGLSPAWKAGETRLAITLPSVAEIPESGDRALVQGTGFLYIRTVGGPTGTSGPLYGPFPINKASFETKLIPPGSYKSIMVLYSSVLLDDRVIGETGLTFRKVFSLPDAELATYMDGVDGLASYVDRAIDGYASGGMTGEVSILEGVRNVIPALTLIPLVADAQVAIETGIYFPVESADVTVERRFFLLEGISGGTAFDKLECTLTAETAGLVGRIGLYESDGSLVAMSGPQGAVIAGGSKTVSVPYTGNDTYYLYLEYSGSFGVSCVGVNDPVVGGVTVSVTGSNPSLRGKKAFFGIYDAAQLMEFMGVPENPVALGIIELDAATGNGSAQAYEPGTTNPPSLTAGYPYVVLLFVDVMGDYNGVKLADITGIGDVSGITPHYGDYMSSSEDIFIPGTNTPTLDGTTFTPYTSHVYFVSESGTGNGRMASAPTTLTAALDNAATKFLTSDSNVEIYLTESITVTTPVTLGRPVSIMSLGNTPFTIDISGVSGGSAFTVPYDDGTYDRNLFLRKVIIDGNNVERAASAITVGQGGMVIMANGAAIKNVKTTVNGGAVSLMGGNLSMMNGSNISYCSAVNGGAVYVSGEPEVSIGTVSVSSGARIENNTATSLGGGIYANNGLVILLHMETVATPAAITGNTAVDGGGIYIDTAGLFSDSESVAATWVTDNVSTSAIPATANIVNNGTVYAPSFMVMLSPGGTPDPGLGYSIGALATESLEFYVDSEMYTNCSWYIDGSPTAYSTGTSLTATTAASLFGSTGIHSVSVIAQSISDGEYYSGFVTVTVTE